MKDRITKNSKNSSKYQRRINQSLRMSYNCTVQNQIKLNKIHCDNPLKYDQNTFRLIPMSPEILH